MTTDQAAEVTIVGGGIHGACLALELARAGRSVALLEAVGIASGASGGPGERGVRACGRDLRELPVAALALERWAELEKALPGGVGYRRTGGLAVFEIPFGARPGEVAREMAARVQIQSALGVSTALLDRGEALAREPGLGASIHGALFCPDDGVADHGCATRSIAAAAEGAGAAVRTAAEVTAILSRGGRATGLRLASGEEVPVGAHLVLLANAAVPALLAPLQQQDELPPSWTIAPQMMFVDNPDGRRLHHLIGHMQRRLAVKQVPDGSFMLSGGWGVEEGEAGRHGALSAISINLADALATFPFLDRSGFGHVDATRSESVTLDRLPIIGRPGKLANVLFAYGWSGHGFALAPGVAALLAEWLRTDRRPDALAPFAPDRFHSPASGARRRTDTSLPSSRGRTALPTSEEERHDRTPV